MILKEYKQIYEKYVNSQLPEWQSIDKNELCNLYLQHKGESIDNVYLSAIILNYWYLIDSWYNRQEVKIATEEDCYETVIDSIQYTLNNHVWTDPTNKLYNDSKGPDKAINIHIKSMKTTFYQLTLKDKRKLNYALLSLDKISENSPEDIYIEDTIRTEDSSFELYLEKYIKDKFLQGNWFLALLIDIIVNNDIFVFKDNITDISQRKLTKCLKGIDLDFIKSFSIRYRLPESLVSENFKKMDVLTYKDLSVKIKSCLFELVYDKEFMQWLRG